MGIFGSKDRQHYFLELYKISDQQSASTFDTQELLLQAIELMEDLTGVKADNFSLNYSNKSCKTIKGFKSQLQAYKEVVYCYVGFNSNETNTYFTVSNPLLNYLKNAKRPDNSAIDISFQVDEDLIENTMVQILAEQLTKQFSFEYGYIDKFPTNRFQGEKKVKKGLFSNSVSVDEMDHLWTNHQIGIINGYLKKLYLINYLNQSQKSNPAISNLIQSYGQNNQVSDKIVRWEVTNEELKELMSSDELLDSCIVTEDFRFLKNPISTQFKSKMTVDE